MTKLFHQEKRFPLKFTTSIAVASGLFFTSPATGTRRSFFITSDSSPANADVGVISEGVVRMPKNSAAAFDFGESVYVPATGITQVEESATGRYEIGTCVSPGGAGSGTTECLVKLHGLAVDAQP